MKDKRILFVIGIVFFTIMVILLSLNPEINEESSDKGSIVKNLPWRGAKLEAVDDDFPLIRKYIDIGDMDVYTISANEYSPRPVLLLHGHVFSSATWEEIQSIQALGKAGYHAIAIDLPGYKKTAKLTKQKKQISYMDFMDQLLTALDITMPVVVSPSMSGIYSVPYVLQHSSKVLGYVPIAPVIGDSYTPAESDFKNCNVSTLIIYGELDKGALLKNQLLSLMPNSEVKMIPQGKHACYLDNPRLFHKFLTTFLDNLKWPK